MRAFKEQKKAWVLAMLDILACHKVLVALN